MADRSFGVREINIVGSAGTPTISSPDNINLNGNRVAISTDLQVGRNATVTGIITANAFYGDGTNLTGVTGVGTQRGDDEALNFGDSDDLQIYHNGVSNIISGISSRGTGKVDTFVTVHDLYVNVHSGQYASARFKAGSVGVELYSGTANNNVGYLRFAAAGIGCTVYGDLRVTAGTGGSGGAAFRRNVAIGTDVLEATDALLVKGDANITGVVTANQFFGDGSGLTNLPGGGGAGIAGISTNGTSYFNIIDLDGRIQSDTFSIRDAGNSITKMFFGDSGTGHVVRLYAGGSEKLTTTSDGIFVQNDVRASGIVSATSFYGDGSNLTNVGVPVGLSTTSTSFFNTIHATGTIDIGTSNAGVAVTHLSIDSADVGGTIRNSIKSGAGNTDAVLDIQTKEFLVTDPYAGKGALISADSSGTKLYKDDSVKLTTLGAGVTVNGTMYATAFSGDGSALTGVPISGSSGSFTNVNTQQLVVSGITTFQNNVNFGDNVVLNIGDTNDLQIYHAGASSVIRDSGTGPLNIQTGGEWVSITDLSGNKAARFYNNDVVNLYYADALRLQTIGAGVTIFGTLDTQQLNVSGVSTFQNNIHLGDDDKINLGDTDDLKIWHAANGTGIIQNAGSGQLQLRSDEIRLLNQATDEDFAFFRNDGAVELYYDNIVRFNTNSVGATVSGILTVTDNMSVASNLSFEGDGTDSFIKETSATGELIISTNQLKIENPSFETLARFNENADVKLYYDNAEKFNTTPQGVNVSGIVTATAFNTNSTTGDGSDRGFTTKYYITSSGASAYRFAGPGVLNSTNNPTLYFHRGFTYILENSTGSGHPFALRVSSGGSAYSPGGSFLTGSQNGTQILTVPFDAPNSIVYQCTLHGGMVGTINFVT